MFRLFKVAISRLLLSAVRKGEIYSCSLTYNYNYALYIINLYAPTLSVRPIYLWVIPGTHYTGRWRPHCWIIKTNCSACVRIVTSTVRFISRILIIIFVPKHRTAAEGLLIVELYRGRETASVGRCVARSQDNVRCPHN
jgi:hypothetical protein